jgi:hypothetical protein
MVSDEVGASPYLHRSQAFHRTPFGHHVCGFLSGKPDGGMSRCKFAVDGRDRDAVDFKCTAENQGRGG